MVDDWQHVAFTMDTDECSSTVRIYVDGQLRASGVSSLAFDTADTVYLGSFLNEFNFLQTVYINYMAYYEYVFTDFEIRADCTDSTGTLLGGCKFCNSTGRCPVLCTANCADACLAGNLACSACIFTTCGTDCEF